MRLTILGSGTCELRNDRSSPAYLLEAGTQKIMLDTGQGALRRLMQCGLKPNDINIICQSHHHLDHMGDLLPFLFALNFDPLMNQSARLTLLASKRFKQILDGLTTVYGHWIEPAPELLTKKLLTPGQEYQTGEVRIATAKAEHIPTSIAFRFEYQGESVVYLGDTALCDDVLELSRGADLLITHCAANDDKPKPGHLNPSAAANLAHDAGVKGLLLSHLYSVVDLEKALDSVSRVYAGSVWLAHDFMTLELSADGIKVDRVQPAV